VKDDVPKSIGEWFTAESIAKLFLVAGILSRRVSGTSERVKDAVKAYRELCQSSPNDYSEV
jgi:hypothetical protein